MVRRFHDPGGNRPSRKPPRDGLAPPLVLLSKPRVSNDALRKASRIRPNQRLVVRRLFAVQRQARPGPRVLCTMPSESGYEMGLDVLGPP